MKRFCTAGVMLACFIMLSGIAVQAAGPKTIFQDDFTTFDTVNWHQSLSGLPDPGVFIKDGVLYLEGFGPRVTSKPLFRYGTLEVRLQMTQEGLPKKWHYLGFFQREQKGDKWERWAESCCFLASDTGAGFTLKTGKPGGGGDIADTGVFKVGDWHTVKIAWSPVRVELFVDGESKGFTEDKAKIPTDFMPVVFDVWAEGNVGVCGMAVDWIKVSGGEIKKGA